MSKFWLLGGAVVIVGVALYFIMMGNKTAPVPAPVPTPTPEPGKTIIKNTVTTAPVSPMTATIQLLEQNESSESGTAVLTEKDGKTVVTLNMVGYNNPSQPAHIHIGPCPDVGSVVYPLTNVVNGKSETTLNVTLAKLATLQPLAINVHKSVPETKVYVSCGNLALPTSTSSSSPAPTTTTKY